MRQWRKQPSLANQAPQKEAQVNAAKEDTIWKELPMPKGSELYPPWSQALLRAARAGRILQTAQKPVEDDKDAGDDEDAEGEPDAGFLVTRWSHVPRESEQPEAEYLAKRRKGLPTLYGGSGSPVALAPLRRTKVRKVGNDGTTMVLEVLVPEGIFIEGEVAESEDVTTQTAAPGTVVEGIGVVNADGIVVASDQVAPTPPRRRPPPPKRKPKGPGRGRKKKVLLENGAEGSPVAIDATSTKAGAISASAGKGIVSNGETGAGTGDDSVIQEGEEGSEDDEDDGDEGDEGDREEGELTDTEDPLSRSATPSKPPTKAGTPLPVSSIPGNGISKSSHLALPSISVQLTNEPSTTSIDTTIPMADLLQPSSSIRAEQSGSESIDEGIAAKESVPSMTPTASQSFDDATNAQILTSSDAIAGELSTIVPDAITPASSTDIAYADPTSSISGNDLMDMDGIETMGTNTQSLATSTHETALPSLPQLQSEQPLTTPPIAEPVDIAAPVVEPGAEIPAELPADHNPLDGLSAPQISEQQAIDSSAKIDLKAKDAIGETTKIGSNASIAPIDTKVPLDNASSPSPKPATQSAGTEDDLFGSLTRHLDNSAGH